MIICRNSFIGAYPRGEDIGFWLNAEIPGSSSETKRFSLADQEVQITLPYPQASSFPIKYDLEYFGVIIPSSARELSYSLPGDKIQERNLDIIFGSLLIRSGEWLFSWIRSR